MNQSGANKLNAVSGQFRTLDGAEYVGPYHITWQGIPATESEPTPTSKTLVPVTSTAVETSTLSAPQPNNTLDENDTVYDLMPTIINRPPIVTKTITEASTPAIKPYANADASGDFMYEFPDGTIRIHKGVTITLKVEAQQPDVLNVENGVLVMKPSNEELVYAWTLDGESLTGNQYDSNTGTNIKLNNNELSIENISTNFAGTYNCTVTNDIGTTDAGTITLEIYNSDVDSFFYNNLIENPNATNDTDNWNSVNDSLTTSTFTTPDGSTQKSIIVDPTTAPSQRELWTIEMLKPRPYSLDAGALRVGETPMPFDLSSTSRFFTRNEYKYTVAGGESIVKAYQDIDLTELESHIKGAVYGVEGLRVLFGAYIGNGLMNYEVNDEFVLPSSRALPDAYYLGAPRLSVENFSKAGPGFVQERVYVTLEEYQNDQPIKSRILEGGEEGGRILTGIPTLQDPWSSRLPKYRGRVYYLGDKNYASPDRPSLGDSRDAHLFVADELTPNYEDRYTYGQYGEYKREVVERLDPRTNKVRITITMEAPGIALYLRERGDEQIITDIDGLWEILSWTSTWPSRSFDAKNNDGYPNPNSPFNQIANNPNYKPDLPLEEKMPKIGISRAMVTGLTFTLFPIYKEQRYLTESEVFATLKDNELTIPESVKSPIDTSLPPYFYDSAIELNTGMM
jgi:hypothetical protein